MALHVTSCAFIQGHRRMVHTFLSPGYLHLPLLATFQY